MTINIFKPLKKIATIHDATVDAGINKNNKIGKYIPDSFSNACTANTLNSIAKASTMAKQVKIVSAKVAFFSIALTGAYIATLSIKQKVLSDRKPKKEPTIPDNLSIGHKRNEMFKYYNDGNDKTSKYSINNKNSIIDTVRERKLSAKKN